jgi:Na+-transporting NADH:ubiquinone oxidoreductase subunit NqrD
MLLNTNSSIVVFTICSAVASAQKVHKAAAVGANSFSASSALLVSEKREGREKVKRSYSAEMHA